MKKLILCLSAVAMLSMTAGCANGPIRSFLRNTICNRGCEAPPVAPSYGVGFDQVPSTGCATGNCNSGQIHGTSYLNDGQIQGDPYIHGSNYGGATINAPVFDSGSSPGFGSTTVPPVSTGILPGPGGT